MITINQQREKTIADYFTQIVFNEERHQYLYEGKQLTSVTQYVKKFVPPFKTHQIAAQVAKSKAKKGLPADSGYYARYWSLKGAVSREIGNLVHWFAAQLPILDEPQTGYEHQIVQYKENEIDGKYKVLATELVMYFGSIAGTCDLILEKEDGTLKIVDWKTTTDFDKSYNKMLPPFQDFRDSAINQYSLQLFLYKWLIESATPYKVSELEIVSIREDSYEVIELNQELIAFAENIMKSKNTSKCDEDSI